MPAREKFSLSRLRQNLSFGYMDTHFAEAGRQVFLRKNVQDAIRTAFGDDFEKVGRNLLFNLHYVAANNKEAANAYRRLSPGFLLKVLELYISQAVCGSSDYCNALDNILSVLSGQNGSPRWRHWRALESGVLKILPDSMDALIKSKITKDQGGSINLGKDPVAEVISALAKHDGFHTTLAKPTARYLEYSLNDLPEIHEFHAEIQEYLGLQSYGEVVQGALGLESSPRMGAEDFAVSVYDRPFREIIGGDTSPFWQKVLAVARETPTDYPNIVRKTNANGIIRPNFLPVVCLPAKMRNCIKNF